MCKCRARSLSGIARAVPPPHLPGHAGIVLVEYTGDKTGKLAKSLFSGVAYEYAPGRPPFFVDARDLGRVLGWGENGSKPFKMVPR